MHTSGYSVIIYIISMFYDCHGRDDFQLKQYTKSIVCLNCVCHL